MSNSPVDGKPYWLCLTALVTLTVNAALALMLGWFAEFIRIAIVRRLLSVESAPHRVAIRPIAHVAAPQTTVISLC
jgi:hypothetical protein